MAGNRRLNGLPDPPDRIRDELDPAVRIELPRGRHEPEVALTDEIHQRNSAVLELLGDRDHETHVVPGQLFLRVHLAPVGATRQGRLFLDGEQGNPADLLEIKIQAFAPFVGRPGELRGARAPRPAGPLLGWHLKHSYLSQKQWLRYCYHRWEDPAATWA